MNDKYIEAAKIILEQLKKAYKNKLLLLSKVLSLKDISSKLKKVLIKLIIEEDD